MAEFAISDNFGDYWQQYGLKQSPFEDYPQFAMYYPVAHWQPHLQFLQNFCRGENPLLLLEGEFGIGKTMFISEASAQLSQTVAIHQIKGRSSITSMQLMHNIAEGLNLPEVLSQPYLPQQIQLALAILQRTQKPCLLIIDDADLMPLETLATLAQIAIAQQNKPVFLYVILACELNLKSHLENIVKETQQALIIKSLDLEPLNIDETKNYLKHRMSRAGFNGKMPFNKEIVQHIYELSSGVPGRINRVAQQTLIDLLKPNEERIPLLQQPKSSFAFLKGSTVKITSTALLLLLILVYWKFQQHHESRSAHLTTVTTHAHKAATPAPVAATPSQVVEQLNLSPANAATPATTQSPPQNIMAQQQADAFQQQISVQNAANPQEFRNAEAQVIAGNRPQRNPDLAAANSNNANRATMKVTSVPPQQNPVTNNAVATVAATPSQVVEQLNLSAAASAGTTTVTQQPQIANEAMSQVSPAATNPENIATAATPAENSGATAVNSVTTATPETATPVAVISNTESEINPQPTKTTEVMGEKKEEKTKTELLNKTERRLLGMEGYTLQLIASRSVGDLKRYLAENKLSSQETMQFQTKLDARPWYVLVYGNYATQQQAKEALRQIFAKTHASKAWVRPMSSVHTAINQK